MTSFLQKTASFLLIIPLSSAATDHVIFISIDGLRPAAIESFTPLEAPNFAKLQAEGAWTHQARTNVTSTSTVPNHVSMATALPVAGADGHNYTSNRDPAATATLHNTKGSYLPSVFDIVHDHGLKTSLYASKSKPVIIDQSYDDTTGALDTTGADNGRDKIDVSVIEDAETSQSIVTTFLQNLPTAQYHYSFLHLVGPDREGHGEQWSSTEYINAIKRVDSYLGDIFATLETIPAMKDNTLIILTADHGGEGANHSDTASAENYTIPFYVWGPGVTAGADLYELNSDTRAHPGTTQPLFSAPVQPIRNGDAPNLALSFLGLPAIASLGAINSDQNLQIKAQSASFPCSIQKTLGGIQLSWEPLPDFTSYTVQSSTDGINWEDTADQWPQEISTWQDLSPQGTLLLYRVLASVN